MKAKKPDGLKANQDTTAAKVAPSDELFGCGNYIKQPSAKLNRKAL
jgi:hypothetical protein